MEKLDDMIIGEITNKNVKRNNCFSHDNTFDLADKKGYGLLYTIRCDCLPKVVPAQYMCKKRTKNHSQPARFAQFNHPIVMVRKMTDEEMGITHQKVHVTFQSTSSCNIQAVNMLSH
eukprot:5352981-Ditylum_brightwellii.AAC.1